MSAELAGLGGWSELPFFTESYPAIAQAVAEDPRVILPPTEQRLAALADGVASIEPPRRLFADIETRIDEIETARPPFIARAGFWQIVAGFAVAALVFVLSNPFLTAPDGPRFAATLGSADAGIEVLAGFDSADGRLRFTRISGAQPPDRDLQVWVIIGDRAPVPVGLLSRNERGALAISAELRAAVPGATLAISEEPLGGSPTGLPTGPILASGTLTRL